MTTRINHNFTVDSAREDIPAFFVRFQETRTPYEVWITDRYGREVKAVAAFRFEDVAEACAKRLAQEAMEDFEVATGRDLAHEHDMRTLQREQLRSDISDEEAEEYVLNREYDFED